MDLESVFKMHYNLDIISAKKNEESTDGNVYNIQTINNKYIAKLYDDFNKAHNMVDIHNYLKELYIPKIIADKDGHNIIKHENNYIVMFSFLDGTQVCNVLGENNYYPEEIVRQIAKEVRRLHDLTANKKFNLQTIEYANNLKRQSVLHYDLTKGNIFVKDNKVGFIDFDDAKYGDSICDIAILLSFLFVSKKRGIDNKSMQIFIDNYYKENEEELKKEEIQYIKPYTRCWIDYLLSIPDHDSSLRDSKEYKKESIEKYEF